MAVGIRTQTYEIGRMVSVKNGYGFESPRTKSTKIKLRNKVIPYLLEVTVVTVAVCQVVVDRWRLRRGVRRQESKDMPRRSSVKVKSADYHLLRFSEAPLTLAFSLSHTYLQTN